MTKQQKNGQEKDSAYVLSARISIDTKKIPTRKRASNCIVNMCIPYYIKNYLVDDEKHEQTIRTWNFTSKHGGGGQFLDALMLALAGESLFFMGHVCLRGTSIHSPLPSGKLT